MIGIKLMFLMIFHPIDAYTEIKSRGKSLSVLPAILILTMVLVVRYLYVSFVHSPLADIKLSDTNLFLEIGRILLPVITVVVSIYAVTTILYGETKLKTIFITVAYSFLPYVITTPIFLIISRFIGLEAAEFYFGASAIKWVWIILLVFFSIMYQNDYTFLKTVGVSVLSIIGVALIWAVIILILSLSVQVVTWFQEVFKEIFVFNS